jgi:hypothetical protein
MQLKARRLQLISVGAMAVLAGAFALAPQAHAASGGGCSAPVSNGSISIKACINANGATVNFDAWVSGSTSGRCSITQTLIDAAHNIPIAGSGTQGCSGGHHVGGSSFQLLGAFRNFVTLTVNGKQVTALSPALFEPF